MARLRAVICSGVISEKVPVVSDRMVVSPSMVAVWARGPGSFPPNRPSLSLILDNFGIAFPRDAQRGKPIGRARKRLAKEREMCLLKRKEPSEYFLRRRLYDQYDMFTSPDSNLAAIGSLNAVLVWGSGPHGALPEPARSA